MTERLFWGGLLCATVGLGLWSLRRASPLHALALAFVATLLAGAFFPLISIWVAPVSWRNLAGLSAEAVVEQQQDYLCFALGLLTAAWIAWGQGWTPARGTRGEPSEPQRARRRDRCVAWGLCGIGLLLYAAYVDHVGLHVLMQRDDYAQKYLAGQGYGFLSFGLPLTIFGVLWAEGSDWSWREKLPFRSGAVAIAAWTLFFLTVRTNFVVLLVGFLWIACRRSGLELRRVRPWLVAVLAVAWIGLETFSQFRGVFRGDISAALRQVQAAQGDRLAVLAGGSELAHPFLTALEVRAVEEPASEGGATYLRALQCFVPQALWPDRPPTLSEAFARRHYSALAASGGGTAYALVAEGYLNFGPLFGPGIAGLVFGLLLSWCEGRARRDPRGVMARALPFWVFLVVIEHRCESASLLKPILSSALPMLALLALAHVIERISIAGLDADKRPRYLRPSPRLAPLPLRGRTE